MCIRDRLKAGQTIGVVVGPEGGFAPEEIALVDEHATMHRISSVSYTHLDVYKRQDALYALYCVHCLYQLKKACSFLKIHTV